MVFAGPVFPEWYWGPIFFAVVFGPPLSALALLADLGVRRWVAPLRGWRRAGLWAGVLAAGTMGLLAGHATGEHVRFERESRAAARAFDFRPYAPRSVPAGFRTKLVRADDFAQPTLIQQYDTGPGYAIGYQQRPGPVSLRPGRCALERLAGTGTNFFEGPCRELRSPRGRRVYVGASGVTVGGREAFALLGGTLVRMQSTAVGDRAVLAWFDALRPVRPGAIDWKGP